MRSDLASSTNDAASTRLADIARPQLGLFTRQQALDAGMTIRTVNAQIRAGCWERVGRGVLGWPGSPHTDHRSIMAAVLSIEGAAASHQSAALLHGYRYIDEWPVSISVPPDAWHRLSGVRVHRYRDLAPDWVTTVDGIPVTTPVRTMIDLAAVLRVGRLERVLDGALADGLDRAELFAAFNRLACRGRRGIGRIRPMLDARGEGYIATNSQLEKRFKEFVSRHNLPEPSEQLPAWWNGRLIGLIDFAYAASNLIVEVDGRLGHTQLLDFELDRLRDQRAVAAGWRVIRVTWRQLRDRPDQVLDVLGATLTNEHWPRGN